jgi:uncharacterized Rossmann fold enzyme
MSSLYERNLAGLSALDPKLADRMRALPWPDPALRLFSSRSGVPTLKVVAHDGEEIRLHSEYDPAKEAVQFLEPRTLAGFDTYLLNGVGLGYVALELARRAEPRRWIACIEAHEGLFRAALESVDLAPLFTRGNVAFHVGHEAVAAQSFLRSFLLRSGALRINMISYPPCVRFHPEVYAAVSAEVDVAIRRQRVELNTILYKGEEMDRNSIRNLEAAAAACPLSSMKDRFKGIPAVVIGAGPSLNAALPHLREAQDRVLLVASDVALRLLVREGIRPHIVTTLDMKEATSTFFQGFEIPDRTVLVFDPDSYHGTVAAFPRRKSTFETAHGLQQWSRDFLGDFGFLDKGTSVAHSAFFISRFLGADPLLLTGVDLSFPSDHTHAEGVQDSVRKTVQEDRTQWLMVPGVQGQPVRTITNFSSYIVHFEAAIAHTQAKVVQTSEIGALIRGAECLPLPAALDRYARAHPDLEGRFRESMAQPSTFDPAAFDRKSSRFIATLKSILELAEEGDRITAQASRRDPSNRLDREKLSAQFRKLKALQAGVLDDAEVVKVLERMVSGAIFDIRTLDREIDDLKEGDPDRVRKTLRQFETLFQGIKPAVEFYLAEMVPLRERILARFPAAGR